MMSGRTNRLRNVFSGLQLWICPIETNWEVVGSVRLERAVPTCTSQHILLGNRRQSHPDFSLKWETPPLSLQSCLPPNPQPSHTCFLLGFFFREISEQRPTNQIRWTKLSCCVLVILLCEAFAFCSSESLVEALTLNCFAVVGGHHIKVPSPWKYILVYRENECTGKVTLHPINHQMVFVLFGGVGVGGPVSKMRKFPGSESRIVTYIYSGNTRSSWGATQK